MKTELNFADHVAACEYMEEESPKLAAWTDGPALGALRVAYVEAHKAHTKALESGNVEAIDTAWDDYCKAQNAWIDALYSGV